MKAKVLLLLGEFTFLNQQTDGETKAIINRIDDEKWFDTEDEAAEAGEQLLDRAEAYLVPTGYKGKIECPAELITYNMIKNELPTTISLIYVDYNDSLDDHTKIMQEVIEQGNLDAIYNEVDDWYADARWEGMREVKDDLERDLVSNYGITEDEADDIVSERFADDVTDLIYDRYDDNVAMQLLSNTASQIMHYDTGYEMESESWNWTETRVKQERQNIKRFLKVRGKQHDEAIDMMIRQATYGGQLLIYFNSDIEDIIDLDDSMKTITFKDFHIGIIDHRQGSGDICHLSEFKTSMEFKRENLFLEQSIDYNWTYAIAGMVHDWCDSTQVGFTKDNSTKIQDSPQNALNEQQNEYKEAYESGKCSAGDMDIKRHRNTTYVNNFPCGHRCSDCGTFWID